MGQATPGTGATITANTLETQLGHAFWLLVQYQSLPEYNPAELNYVQYDIDPEESVFTGAFDLPCTRELTGGKPAYTAINYLQNVPFTPGNPSGSFISLSLPSYFLEILTFMQGVEANPRFNLAAVNNLSGTYDTDTSIFSGQLSLPIRAVINPDGVIVTSFLEYLTYPVV